MPGFIGLPEMILLAVVVLLVFGPKRLPEMGRSIGKGLREFKDSVSGDSKGDADVDLREFGHPTASLEATSPVRATVSTPIVTVPAEQVVTTDAPTAAHTA